MNSIPEEISALSHLAHSLLYLGMDGSPVYSDDLARMSGETFRLSNKLYDSGVRRDVPEEEAALCLALLMGYNATFCDHGDKQQRIQHVLDRIWAVLPNLPDTLLKVRLLTYSYGEVYDEELSQEAHRIIDSWSGDTLTAEQVEIIGELKNIEENPYPFEEITDN